MTAKAGFTSRSVFLTSGKAALYLFLTIGLYWGVMFEGNLQEAGFAKAVENGELQPLSWPLLVARLAAARDLRGVFARGKSASGGNFACFSTDPSTNLNELEPSVNREASADCKTREAIVPAAAQEAETGDREL